MNEKEWGIRNRIETSYKGELIAQMYQDGKLMLRAIQQLKDAVLNAEGQAYLEARVAAGLMDVDVWELVGPE